MFKKITTRILENSSMPSIPQWIAGLGGVITLRSFFEMNSNPQNAVIAIEVSSRIHYIICLLAVLFLLVLAVSVIAKQRGGVVVSLALYGLPIIFLAPIIDLFVSGGAGARMSFIFDGGQKLVNDFFTAGGYHNGFSLGMQIEMLIILMVIGWYVWMKMKKFSSTIGAILISYLCIFIIGAIPGIFYTLTTPAHEVALTPYAYDYVEASVVSSNIPANIVNGSLQYASYDRLVTLGTTAFLSQILFIIFVVVGLMWFWYAYKNTFNILLANIRATRILFYLSLLSFGAWLAHRVFSVTFTWVDWMSMIVLGISWLSACMFAIHVNDIADIDIDKVSSPDRPLANNSLTPHAMREIGYIWLIVSLLGAYIVGYYPFFMMTVFTSAYYVYSAQPLRLKRVPILSSFLISLAILSTILAGFYFVSPNKMIGAFPSSIAFGIVLMFTLGVNIRDIKDVAGDRKAGVKTLPVIFGKYGKNVVGGLLALSFLMAPFFLPFFTTYLIAVPAALLGYWLCVREPYRERYIFLLFFVFGFASVFIHSIKG